jgi:ribosomal protein S14
MREPLEDKNNPYNLILCSVCGKPCGIIHDLDMSDCCLAPLLKGSRRKGNEDI